MIKLLRRIFVVFSLSAVLALSGCGGPQEATEEAGHEGMDQVPTTDADNPDAAAGGPAAPAE